MRAWYTNLMDIVESVTGILAFLTLVSHVGIVLALVVFIGAHITGRTKQLFKHPLFRWIASRGLLLSFIVAVTATVGSLFFSEVAGYEPCKLCWYQRIFMYPLVIIFGLVLGKRERITVTYGLVMSALGAFVAANHYYLQTTKTSSLIPCSTVGYSVSCADTFVMNYGYITIPMMALTAFVLICIGMLMYRHEHVQKNQR
jgi:disulfide bond formation protein DsbB